MKVDAEIRVMWPQTKKYVEPPELEETGRIPLYSLWREDGPTGASILDF